MKNTFFTYSKEQLKDLLITSGFKAYSAEQIFKWVYEKQEFNPEKMTNISKDLQAFLLAFFDFSTLNLVEEQRSKTGTNKYLFRLEDGIVIETVLMDHDYGLSLCVTTQAGCSMGCSFCASGLVKKERDLRVAELVLQVISVQVLTSKKITHLVLMGTGEPFDNYQNIMRFIEIVNDKNGLQIGARHITVSTSGIVPMIYEFAKEKIKANLAISLHAPNDALRTKLMKVNRAYPLADLIEAVKAYYALTKRRVTFEYILLKGVNDELSHANQLSDLIRGINAYVNLIPYNPVSEFTYEKTDMERAGRFHQQLLKRGINATLRKEMGSDIDAACGQLRLKK